MFLLLSFSAFAFAGAALEVPPVTPAVNADLEKFQENLDKPQLLDFGVNNRVTMVFGYDYSNWTIIDGDDGLVIVDTGWFIERTRQALRDFRQSRNNQKPIKAIIFTHMHSDHRAGVAGLFDEGESKDVAIYAHRDWQRQVRYDANAGQMLTRRGMAQMGFVLPYKDLAGGTFGAGIGREALRGGTLSAVYSPTVAIDVGENSAPVKVTIAGVPMAFYYAPSDIDAQLMVWLPQDKVALVGDAVGGTLPYIITPRHEPERKPESFLYTFRQIEALDADNLIPGHGRPLQGREDIAAVIASNYEITTFLYDQVRGYIDRGYSADMIIDVLEVPPRLASNPDLQPHYHTLPWLIRGLYANEAGWVQDIDSLTQHSASEQARRWLKLVGADTILTAAATAIEEEDYRWAISLADLVLSAEPQNADARKLLVAGLQGVAYTTVSAGERNYALTAVGTATGALDWDQIFNAVTARQWEQRDAAAAFDLFGRRFQSVPSYGQNFTVQFNVPDEGAFIFTVHDGVLLYQPVRYEQIDAQITMDLATVRAVGSKALSLSDALQLPQTQITLGREYAERFASLIQ
jgi:uncharacterized sulfatase